MNLRNKIRAVLFGLSLMAVPSLSVASSGSENILGKQFCNTKGIPNSGWGFSQDGTAYFFAPNIGAPNPFTYYKVVFLKDADHFAINEYEKGTNRLILQVANFIYLNSTQSIVSGPNVLSVAACR